MTTRSGSPALFTRQKSQVQSCSAHQFSGRSCWKKPNKSGLFHFSALVGDFAVTVWNQTKRHGAKPKRDEEPKRVSRLLKDRVCRSTSVIGCGLSQRFSVFFCDGSSAAPCSPCVAAEAADADTGPCVKVPDDDTTTLLSRNAAARTVVVFCRVSGPAAHGSCCGFCAVQRVVYFEGLRGQGATQSHALKRDGHRGRALETGTAEDAQGRHLHRPVLAIQPCVEGAGQPRERLAPRLALRREVHRVAVLTAQIARRAEQRQSDAAVGIWHKCAAIVRYHHCYQSQIAARGLERGVVRGDLKL